MPKFRVTGDYGFAGTDFESIWEGEDHIIVGEFVRQAMNDVISYCVEEISDKEAQEAIDNGVSEEEVM